MHVLPSLVLGLLGCTPSGLNVQAPQALGPGKLATLRLSPSEAEALRAGGIPDTLFATLIERMKVQDVDFANPVRIAEPSEGDEVLAVFQPPGNNVWDAVFGNGNPHQWTGWSTVEGPLVLEQSTPPPPKERCAGDGKELMVLPSPEVVGRTNNAPDRRLCVMLPPSYVTQPTRRYPVVYLLPGLGGTDTSYRHLHEVGHEVILVGIDTKTAFGAAYFFDSPAGGDWETFLERAVQAVDTTYRTRPAPIARAVLGHSTGGYNAISLVLRRMDLFNAAGASAPDALDLESWLFEDGTVSPLWKQWATIDSQLEGPGQLRSYAVQFGSSEALPFDLATGKRDEVIWSQWAAVQPLPLLADPVFASRARQLLNDRIYLSVGRRDAFDLFAPAETFHRRLEQLDLTHGWVATDDGHFDGSRQRREAALSYLAERLTR